MEIITISSVPELRKSVSDIMMLVKQMNYFSDEREYDLRLCLRELLQNSLNYSGYSTVKLLYEATDDHFRFSVVDKGKGFSVNVCPTCPDVMSESGRGIFLVHELADFVRYNKKGTAVTVKFYY